MTTDDRTPMPITDPARIPRPRRHDDHADEADQLARRYADLLAAARAAVAAEDDGEADPLWYVRDELAAQDPTDDRDDW